MSDQNVVCKVRKRHPTGPLPQGAGGAREQSRKEAESDGVENKGNPSVLRCITQAAPSRPNAARVSGDGHKDLLKMSKPQKVGGKTKG